MESISIFRIEARWLTMPMKAPAHPGRLIKGALDDLGATTTEAARALGVTRQHLNNVIAGRSVISPEMAIRLEKGLGSTAETWIAMQRNHDLALARRGFGSITVERIVGSASIPAE
jgi:antitoxin HigA-1